MSRATVMSRAANIVKKRPRVPYQSSHFTASHMEQGAPLGDDGQEEVVIFKKKRLPKPDSEVDQETSDTEGIEVQKSEKKCRFIDDSAGESRPRRGRPAGKKSKTSSKMMKKMLSAQARLPSLLDMLHDRHSPDHYYWHTIQTMDIFAEGIKWAHTPQRDEQIPDMGAEEFWEWWSAPMERRPRKNPRWIAMSENSWIKNPDSFFDESVPKLIASEKEGWYARYEKANPIENSWHRLKSWVVKEAKKRNVIVDPDYTDDVVSGLAMALLKDVFIITESDGASISWDKDEKLWIMRKKDRSAPALGSLLKLLVGEKIQFTDSELETKFIKKISSVGGSGTILSWLRGTIPKFPHPVKDLIDRDCWTIAVKDGKIIDLTTLVVRDRVSTDLYTVTTDFSWVTEHKVGDIYIMDKKKLETFKEVAKAGDIGESFRLMSELCPNAYEFTRGPFQCRSRHHYMLAHFGLFVTSHRLRKGIWIFGDGKGMKSTLFEAIVKCLGDFGVIAAKTIFFTGGSESSHNTDFMRTVRKRFILVDELQKTDKLKESTYKQYAAGATISMREIYGGQGEEPTCGLLVIITNTIPPMQFTDSAVPDRILPIRGTTRVFNPSTSTRSAPHYKSDKEWKDGYAKALSSEEELDHYCQTYWVLEDLDKKVWADSFKTDQEKKNELGCLLVLAAYFSYYQLKDTKNHGQLPTCPIVRRDFADFMKTADQAGQYISENTQVNEYSETAFTDVYQDYRQWSKESGVNPMEKKAFKDCLKQQGLLNEQGRVVQRNKEGRIVSRGGEQITVRVALNSNIPIISYSDKESIDEQLEMEEAMKKIEKEKEKQVLSFFN